MSAVDREITEAMVQDKEISIWEIDQRLRALAETPHPSYETLGEIEELEARKINLKAEIDDINDLGAPDLFEAFDFMEET